MFNSALADSAPVRVRSAARIRTALNRPANEAVARRTKLAELERAHEQLLEEECKAAAAAEAREREAAARCEHEAAAQHEHEAAERQRQEAAERQECEIAETRDCGHQQDRCPCSEAGGSQAR